MGNLRIGDKFRRKGASYTWEIVDLYKEGSEDMVAIHDSEHSKWFLYHMPYTFAEKNLELDFVRIFGEWD